MATILAVLNAISAIPKIAGYVEQLAAAMTTWYVQRQTAQNKQAIIDALALDLHAQSDEDRYAAAKAWQDALSRPRVSNS